MKHFVFIGDSVTDSNRKRSKKYAGTEAALGHGWVKILAGTALSDQVVWNRGFSGYRTADTLVDFDSWPEEVVTADVTTLMIGINDIWHTFKQHSLYHEQEIVQRFEALIIKLKNRTTQLIVMEPVALVCGEVGEHWLPKMTSLFLQFKQVCNQEKVQWVSLQKSLEKVAKDKPGEYLHDGVHPSDKGHQWLAEQWLAQVPTTLFL